MSENKLQNEEELWSVLDGTVPAAPVKSESKPARSEGKFAKPGAPKGKLDSFFLTCMAGVAAVSVAATLLVTSLTGTDAPGRPAVNKPAAETTAPAEGETVSDALLALELENAELRAQIDLQKQQIKDLQAQVLDLSGGTAALPTVSADPEENQELVDAQVEAYDILNQIREAYADFDREKLEELIPEMDKRLTYLSSDAMNEYYKILEYVEMPSNG